MGAGDHVLVTGASQGIGRAIARHLSLRGYRIIGTSRRPADIEKPLPHVRYMPLDLNDPDSIKNCIAGIRDIDILINNAGRSHIAPAETYPLQRVNALFQTNLFGPIQLIQGFLPGMRQRRYGFIINIGSLVGRFSLPFQASYAASKSALTVYSQALRSEMRPFGIRVTVLEPGDVRTTIKPDSAENIGTAYTSRLDRFSAARLARMKKARHPDGVARKIVHILRQRHPAPGYAMDAGGALLLLAQRLLPARVVEALVCRTYGLDGVEKKGSRKQSGKVLK